MTPGRPYSFGRRDSFEKELLWPKITTSRSEGKVLRWLNVILRCKRRKRLESRTSV